MLRATILRLVSASRQLRVRVSLFALLAVAVAILAPWIEPLVPGTLADRLGAGSVRDILSILSSSMLAVTTFSLSVMVTAQHSAAGQSTPRAHRVMLEDATTQTVLATFLGAFLFSLVALILLEAGYYRSAAPVSVFVAALLALATSVYLWFSGHREEGLFVALWVPSILAFATYIKVSTVRK
jgi:uncharacterized membrane protein